MDIRLPRAALESFPAAAKALERPRCSSRGSTSSRRRMALPTASPLPLPDHRLRPGCRRQQLRGRAVQESRHRPVRAHKHATDTHVVITIRGIGEMEPNNGSSNVTLDLNNHRTTSSSPSGLGASRRAPAIWNSGTRWTRRPTMSRTSSEAGWSRGLRAGDQGRQARRRAASLGPT